MTLRELVASSGAGAAIAARPTVVESREQVRDRFNSGLDELDELIGWDKLIGLIGIAAAGLLAARIMKVYISAKRRKSQFARKSVVRMARYTNMRVENKIKPATFNALVTSETVLIRMNTIRVDQEIKSDLLKLADQIKNTSLLIVDVVL